MRLTPLIALIFVLLSPLSALAAGNMSISPIGSISSLTSVNVSSGITANHTDYITPVSSIQTQSSTVPSENAGEEMIINAISRLIVNFADLFVNGLGGVQTGKLNNTNVSGEKVAIFAVVAHTIDPTTDPATMKDVGDFKQFYVYIIVIFALLLALFLLFQQVRPHNAAQIVETVTGQYGYVDLDEMISYYAVTCGWLLFGPLEFYSAIWLNNYLVQSLMLSVLDLVAFNRQNIMLYVTMVILWLILVAFFALRLVTIMMVVRVWYLFGLLLAVKRIRWLGLLVIAYMNGVVFYQFILVWPAVTIVSYVHTHAMSGFSEGFIYLGLFLLEIVITAIVVLWPLFFAILSPKTWKTVMMVARYAV
jgi:hypothetical protein